MKFPRRSFIILCPAQSYSNIKFINEPSNAFNNCFLINRFELELWPNSMFKINSIEITDLSDLIEQSDTLGRWYLVFDRFHQPLIPNCVKSHKNSTNQWQTERRWQKSHKIITRKWFLNGDSFLMGLEIGFMAGSEVWMPIRQKNERMNGSFSFQINQKGNVEQYGCGFDDLLISNRKMRGKCCFRDEK